MKTLRFCTVGVPVNLLLLDHHLDGLNISELEADSAPYFLTHLAMPE